MCGMIDGTNPDGHGWERRRVRTDRSEKPGRTRLGATIGGRNPDGHCGERRSVRNDRAPINHGNQEGGYLHWSLPALPRIWSNLPREPQKARRCMNRMTRVVSRNHPSSGVCSGVLTRVHRSPEDEESESLSDSMAIEPAMATEASLRGTHRNPGRLPWAGVRRLIRR